MSAHLHHLLNQAEAQLAPVDQARLEAMVESFVRTHTDQADFSDEELAHIRQIEDEDFVEADPARLAAYFARGK